MAMAHYCGKNIHSLANVWFLSCFRSLPHNACNSSSSHERIFQKTLLHHPSHPASQKQGNATGEVPSGKNLFSKESKDFSCALAEENGGETPELSYPWAPLLSASRLLPSLPWCLNQHPFDSDFGWLVFYLFHCGGREKQRSLNDAKASTISYISPCDYFIEIHHWVSSIVLDNFCY